MPHWYFATIIDIWSFDSLTLLAYYTFLVSSMYLHCIAKKKEESMFLSLKFLKKYKLDPFKFFGSHLVLQVSKPDKFYPKPDFDPRWPGLTDELYIQKIAKKTENWWQPRCLGALGAWKFMWCFDIRGARGKKNKFWLKK